MMRFRVSLAIVRRACLAAGLAWIGTASGGEPSTSTKPASDEPLLRAMRDELVRSSSQLQLPDAAKPYYIAYRVNDQTAVAVAASFGAMTRKQVSRSRILHVDVRAGDYSLDNSGAGRFDFGAGIIERLPIEDDYDAIRHDAWYATDRQYKQAAADYSRKVALRKTRTQSPDDVGDFSHETPVTTVMHREAPKPDLERAAALVKELSDLAKTFPEIQASDVALSGGSGRQILMTSEGTFADENDSIATLTATLQAQADDGMPLSRVISFSHRTLDGLPSRDQLREAIVRAARQLSELRHAPPAEDYSGPVLFEAPAAAMLVHDMLARQVCGAPPPKTDASSASDSETEWSSKIGQRVLSPTLSLIDDPTIDHLGKLFLVAGYAADDEGMPPKPVRLVDKGVLETLLMSRAPRKGFEHSNGHGRATMVGSAKAAISNLVLSADKPLSASDLRKRLLSEARAAKAPYGLIVRTLDESSARGDYSSFFGLGRSGNLSPPIELARVYPDGREEPLRGGTFSSLPLRAFEEILAAGDEPAVRSWTFGMTASVVSPALLFKHVELKKPAGPQRKPPILVHPYFEGSGR